ncbi:MAG TPA: murein biosynthesis integral membrane protein MurJ [Oligoflexia bacterium]|nr:murein biosynthesis integral membrane protein MurJ [Oligoflexia bacterium]HMP48445.1 murein biosynthesis integral membrane protein MurJ [Oligoflexia bacterium]
MSNKTASSFSDSENRQRSESDLHTYIVAFCILISRISGLIRELLFAYFLGTSAFSDALKAALRIPNFLQNLFGEGVLSASFIPVYAKLNKEGKNQERIKLAKEVGILVLCLSTFLVSLGLIFSQSLVSIFAPGFDQATSEICRKLLILIFPGVGLLTLSAWCLAILNSHRFFALSYSAPIFWNLSVILPLSGLLIWANIDNNYALPEIEQITLLCGYLILIGSSLQLFVQIPKTISLLKNNDNQAVKNEVFLSSHTKEVIRNFVPVFIGRGAVQISAYIDTIVASFLVTGSLSVLMYAQTIFLLPISVFAMAISAAELPALSEESSDAESSRIFKLIDRLRSAENRVFFFCIPCSILFMHSSSGIISLVFGSGAFDARSVNLVGGMLMVLGGGLVPAALSRLYASSLFAVMKQKTVSRIAIIRILAGTITGILLCFYVLPDLRVDDSYIILGLGIGATFGSLVELVLLIFPLRKITEYKFLPVIRSEFLLVISASYASLISGKLLFNTSPDRIYTIFSLTYFVMSYFLFSYLLRVSEARSIIARIKKLFISSR